MSYFIQIEGPEDDHSLLSGLITKATVDSHGNLSLGSIGVGSTTSSVANAITSAWQIGWVEGFIGAQCPSTNSYNAPALWAYCWEPNSNPPYWFHMGGLIAASTNHLSVQVYPSLTFETISGGGAKSYVQGWTECGTSVIGAADYPDLVGTFDAAATCMSTLLQS